MTAVNLNELFLPPWTIFFVPAAAWIILLRVLLVNASVLLAALCFLRLPRKREIWKCTILRICGLGFLADCLGALLSFGLYAFLMPVGFPGEQLAMLPGVAFAGAMIYLFDSAFVFKTTGIEQAQLHKLSLALAICTAPYTMFLPLSLF